MRERCKRTGAQCQGPPRATATEIEEASAIPAKRAMKDTVGRLSGRIQVAIDGLNQVARFFSDADWTRDMSRRRFARL